MIEETIRQITPVPTDTLSKAEAHLDRLTKPLGSLGRLEKIAARLVGIQGEPPHVGRRRAVVFAADHGVTTQGVSAYPREVTKQMVLNFLAGGAAINVLGRQAGAEVRVVDVGVDADFAAAGLLSAKVARGTRDFTREPAMTTDEARRAMTVGIEQAREAAADSIDCLVTGDMGIGNSTAAAAIYCALLPANPSEMVGRGTGVDDAGLARKRWAIEVGLARHRLSAADPVAALAAVGGFEIAAIAGLCLGGVAARIPVVVDGFIAGAGALAAIRMKPIVQHYLFFGHCSQEGGHRRFLEAIDERPLLDLDMRLGEGTGAMLASYLLEAACRIYTEMATFESAGVSQKGSEPLQP